MMNEQQKKGIKNTLLDATATNLGVAGVVAGLTDQHNTLFLDHSGKRDITKDDEIQNDAVFSILSCSKAITTTIALQQYEQGLLDLDAPAQEYVPELGEIRVLAGFDRHDQPILNKPKTQMTTRMLLLHTAGFGYEFLDQPYAKLIASQGYSSALTAAKAALNVPLLFEPGTQWSYGINIDWAGVVTEAVGKKDLSQLMQEQIFQPLGMNDTSFILTDSMHQRLATMHHRTETGELFANPDFILPQDPEVFMGGHGLYSTVEDYLKFIRLWLNRGNVNGQQLLKASTVELAFKNGLSANLSVGALNTVNPALTTDINLFPDVKKGWSLGFMTNEQPLATGRPAHSLSWAGLANLYYWIDLHNNIGGFWATQTLPFFDAAAVSNYINFEMAVYKALKS